MVAHYIGGKVPTLPPPGLGVTSAGQLTFIFILLNLTLHGFMVSNEGEDLHLHFLDGALI